MNQDQVDKLLEAFEANLDASELLMELAQDLCDEKNPPMPPMPRIRGAVWKGGGVKVFGYVGAIQEMTRLGVIDDLTHVGGSSGGSIFAMLFALGFSGKQILAMGEHLDMRDLTDVRHSTFGDYFASSMLGKLVSGSLSQGYMFSGDHIRDFVGGMLEHALGSKDATFRDLHEARKSNPTLKDLYLIATKLRSSDTEDTETVFGFDRFPDVRIIDAFCASLALPMVYKPVEVFQKDGTSIGFFTDGGIYNNFPIQLYDEPLFCEPHYPLQSIRYRNLQSYHYNPSTVGFTLITDLKELNPQMTPLTERLQTLVDEDIAQPSPESDENSLWYKIDLIRAILANTFGKLTVEDEKRKHFTHPQGIVQIYVEGVDTIEFHLSGEKFERLVTSGQMAYRLWYQQFHDAQNVFEGEYNHHPSLSLEQRQRKANNYYDYLQDRLAQAINEFMEELKRRADEGVEELAQNARLKFNAYRILRDTSKIKQRESLGFSKEVISKAWTQAAHDDAVRQGDLIAVRSYLDKFAQRDLCLQWLKKLALSNHTFEVNKFRNIIKAQISRLLYYTFEAPEPLLGYCASHAPWHLEFLFDEIKNYLSLRYQSDRPIHQGFISLINQKPQPPLLHCAHQYFSLEPIEICLRYGANILTRDYHDKTAFHQVIDLHDYERFRFYVDYMRKNKVFRKRMIFGFEQQPIMFYLCQPQHQAFVQLLINQLPREDWLWLSQLDSNIKDVKGNTVFDHISCLRIDVWASLVQILTQGKTRLHYTHCQANRLANEQSFEQEKQTVLAKLTQAPLLDIQLLKDVHVDALLALLVSGDNPLIKQCLEQNAQAFTQALVTKLKASGHGGVLSTLLAYEVEQKTLREWAKELQALWFIALFSEPEVVLTDSPATLLFSAKPQSGMQAFDHHDFDLEDTNDHLNKLSLSD